METREFNPPYLAFKTLLNLVERLSETSIPNRIDRTYLSYLAGITQTYLLAALRTFGLIDAADKPTDKLIRLVNERETRSQQIGELVQTHYAEALALGEGATPGELEELFREKYGVRGETNRKAITFFLNAAGFAGIPLSQHYKLPRARGGSSENGDTPVTRRKRITGARRNSPNPVVPENSSSVDTLRTRYIDMLMKRAEADEELDPALLDRIETLLGFAGQGEEDTSEN
jgi:hypothetical protein